jgi:hypothetical protein
MKINIEEIKDKIIAVNGNDITKQPKNYGYLKVPSDDKYEYNNNIYDFFVSVWYSVKNDYIELEYSENGVKYNSNSDWNIELYSDGKFKGKGSTKHKETIKSAIEWLLRAAYEEKYNHLLLGQSPL